MTEQNLNDTDALLAQMNEAIRNNDLEKLDKLFEDQPIQENQLSGDNGSTGNQPDRNNPAERNTQEVVGGGNQHHQSTPVTEDWLEKVPEEVRENILRLKEQHDRFAQDLHRYKSDHGRVAAYQRKADQLQRELEQLRKQSKDPTKPQENIAAALKIESDEDFQRLLEADPTFARMFERQLKKVAETVEESYGKKFQELNTRIATKEEDDFLSREQEKLLSYVPNAAEVVSHPAWQEFKELSPPGVRVLAESVYADDLYLAMQLYGQFVHQRYQQPTGQEAPANNTQPAPASSQSAPPSNVDKIAQERQRKLQGGPGVQPSKPTAASVPIEDPETLLKKYYEEIRKESGYSK